MHDIDVCALMANLLDNALEACEKILESQPWIKLKIKKKNDMLLIYLSNCFNKNIEKRNFFQSDKNNNQLHGWGMKSIEGVVKKYQGNMEYAILDSYIEIFVNIPIE